MKRTAIAATIFVSVIAFLAGVRYSSWRKLNSYAVAGVVGADRYTCPMHPQYLVDVDGSCPSCGMRLVPAKRSASERTPVGGDDPGTTLATIRIGPEKQQILGIRTRKVEKTSGFRRLRVPGRVAVDETRAYKINAPVTGWIREIYPYTVGSRVHVNQLLATIYAPEFLSPQQAYLYRLDALDLVRSAGTETPKQVASAEANIQGAADILRSLGMHDIQIEELRRTRQLMQKIGIYSPATGFILKRDVSLGMRFEAGSEFYRIADLSRVWILADIFEPDAHVFKPGATAAIIYGQRKAKFRAVVSDVLPQFDPATRTLNVRLETDNPEFTLSPGMFVDVEFPVRLPPGLSIPVEALVESGLRETVFVDLGDGYFEPRAIRTGWRAEDRVEVTEGLMEGERVVVGGNFLVDSESRLAASTAPGSRSFAAAGDLHPGTSGNSDRPAPHPSSEIKLTASRSPRPGN
jgi:Cu(I)/Ag(I) efflux system membrane fusion protein